MKYRRYAPDAIEQEAKKLFMEFMATLPDNDDYQLTNEDYAAREAYMEEHASKALKAYWREMKEADDE